MRGLGAGFDGGVLGRESAMSSQHATWSAGQSYDHYMGRWSRMISMRFIEWLDPPSRADWLEIGCGTGALTATIVEECDPSSILATDQSADFIRYAASSLRDDRLRFARAEAQELPLSDGSVDIVASGLVLNFVRDRTTALAEMQRALRPGGLVSFYVWDYPGGGMGFIDAFWRAAATCDPEAAALDEASRYSFCTEQGLRALCADAALCEIETTVLEITTDFADFEAFWHPFTLGAGPAPGYCCSLDETQRAKLKRALSAEVGTHGPIALPARARAVKASFP